MFSNLIVVVVVLLSIPSQIMITSLLTDQATSKKRILNSNGTNNDTQIIVNELRKIRSILEESGPRQVVLFIVSFFVAMAFTIFAIQLSFRPQKSEFKYFTAAILSLIIPVTVLLISYVGSNILGVHALAFTSINVWLFASLMLLIPIFTLIILMILHRIARER